MDAVKPVTIAIEGVERRLRFTAGARKLIVDLLGMSMQDALNKYDSGAFPAILFALMHDEQGNPPDLTLKWLEWNLPDDARVEILAAIMSAANQGRVSKNDLEALIRQQMEREISSSSTSSVSALSASDSASESSGGNISNANSSPESTDGEKNSSDSTTGPE